MKLKLLFYKSLLHPLMSIFFYLGITILINIYTSTHENHFIITSNDKTEITSLFPPDCNTRKIPVNELNDDNLTIADLLFFYEVTFKDPSEIETDNIDRAFAKQIDIERAIKDNIIHHDTNIDIQLLWQNFHNTISHLSNNNAVHEAMNYVKNNLPNNIWLPEGSKNKLTSNSLLKHLMDNIPWNSTNELRSKIFLLTAIHLQQHFINIHYTCDSHTLENIFMHHVLKTYDDLGETITDRLISLFGV